MGSSLAALGGRGMQLPCGREGGMGRVGGGSFLYNIVILTYRPMLDCFKYYKWDYCRYYTFHVCWTQLRFGREGGVGRVGGAVPSFITLLFWHIWTNVRLFTIIERKYYTFPACGMQHFTFWNTESEKGELLSGDVRGVHVLDAYGPKVR